jgi:hypothetical protein
MSAQLYRILIALCGILGTVLLGLYFGVGFSTGLAQLSPAVVLIEGVFTIDLAQAAANGHQVTSLTSFDLMTVFTYIYPIVPAPVIFLGLGTILLGSRLLPRVFGFLAFGLGIAFAVVGLIALFTTAILSIVVLSLQALWVLAAALTLLIRAGTAPDTTGEASPGS